MTLGLCKALQSQIRNLPNILSASRCLLPPLVLIPCYNKNPQLAGILFFVLALTDYLDGVIARKLGYTSTLGAILDPIGDKVLLSVGGLLIIAEYPTELYILGIILSRDFIVTGMRCGYALETGLDLPVSSLAKLKTSISFFALTLFFLTIGTRSVDTVPYVNTTSQLYILKNQFDQVFDLLKNRTSLQDKINKTSSFFLLVFLRIAAGLSVYTCILYCIQIIYNLQAHDIKYNKKN